MTPTESQLREMMPSAGSRLDAHLPYIRPALEEASIDTGDRVAAFVAQLAHESGEYRFMEELADGSNYEGRSDLGNIYPGDGVRFKGRGPIQVTGRANYAACGMALGLNLLDDPSLLARPENGTRAACWFWNSRNLSLLADRNWFLSITRRINGGLNGLPSRLSYWALARSALGLPEASIDGEESAVKDFQIERGLMADGIVGPATIAALAAP